MPPIGYSRGGRARSRRATRRRFPSATQIALAQERSYRSQAKAVKRVAQAQRIAGPGTPSVAVARQRRAAAKREVAMRRREAAKQRGARRRQQTRTMARLQRRASRQTERSYASQGRAVEHVANLQRAGYDPQFAKRARDTGLLSREEIFQSRRRYLARHREPVVDIGNLLGRGLHVVTGGASGEAEPKGRRLPGATAGPLLGGAAISLPAVKAQSPEITARRIAPALPVLEQLNRPIYGVASGAKQAVRDIEAGRVPSPERVVEAVGRGVTLKEKTLFSDVLAEAGVENKTIRTLAGFGLDVALDPTTYVTFGLGSVATKSAAAAAERVAVSAARAKARELAPKLAAGQVTRKQARAQAKAAGRRAAAAKFKREIAKAKPGRRGLTVSVAGGKRARRAGRAVRRAALPQAVERRIARRDPFAPLTRATAGAGRVIGAPSRGLRRTRAGRRTGEIGQAGRQILAGAHAGVRPAGLSAAEHRGVKAVRREARSTSERLARRSLSRANALLGRLHPDERRLVIDAIEANDLKRLKSAAPTRLIRGRRRSDPDRLLKVARQVRDELRYRQRVEGRVGSLFSRVGERSRGRDEIAFMAQAGRAIPKTATLDRRVAVAERAFAAARNDLRAASTQTARRQARAALQTAGRELTGLRRRRATVASQTTQIRAARTGLRQARRERLAGEARGYFPHVSADEAQGTIGRILQPVLPEQVRPSSTVKTREHREPLSAMRAGTPLQQARAARFVEDVREAMAQTGAGTAVKAQAAIVNRKLVETFGRPVYAPRKRSPLLGPPGSGVKLKGTADAIKALTERGEAVYRLRGGQLQRLGLDELVEIRRAAAGRPGNGRYVILRDRIVEQATKAEQVPGSDLAPLIAFDALQRGWKSFTLKTPGYLVRNLLGDLFNAFGRENGWRLARNVIRGQRALNALGRLERAERRFDKSLDPKLRQIKLTPEQAREIAGPSAERLFQIIRKGNPDLTKAQVRELVERNLTAGKVPAIALAQLAERMGVVRQGRFLELVTESKLRPTKEGAWQQMSKRVEDSVRIATFMGGLQRGLSPRRAADRATDVHFDYGDLTRFEKGVSRRLMPFYTFTSRNVPYQTKLALTRPGKLATVAKAREEARRAAGLPEGYEADLDEFEARQLGLPVRFGDQVVTLSVGSPFVDLNDVFGVAQGIGPAVELTTKRLADLTTPAKLIPELVFNYSTFYRDEIQPDERPETRAPDWAIALAELPGGKALAKATGLTPDWLDSATGERAWGWNRKADYFFRNLFTGPGRVAIEGLGLGPDTLSARRQTQAQRRLGLVGVRARTYERDEGRLQRLYDERDDVQKRMDRLNSHAHPSDVQPNGRPYPINAEHPTPEYARLSERNRQIERQIDTLQKRTRPGGIVKGRPNVPATSRSPWEDVAGSAWGKRESAWAGR